MPGPQSEELLDLGFWYCICQLNQYIVKYWDGNAVYYIPPVRCQSRAWSTCRVRLLLIIEGYAARSPMLIVVDRSWSRLIMQTRDKKGCATCNRGRLNKPQSILWPDTYTVHSPANAMKWNGIEFGIGDSWVSDSESIVDKEPENHKRMYFLVLVLANRRLIEYLK